MKRRQLTKNELLNMCKSAAYDKRISKSSAWFMCTVTSSYCLWKNERLGAVKISSVLNRVNEKELAYTCGELDLEEIRKRIIDKYKLTFAFEEEIVATRTDNDKFQTFLNKIELSKQNQTTEIADRFALLLLDSLTEIGFGAKRLDRVNTDMFHLISESAVKHNIFDLHRELKDYAGLELERPKDYMKGVS